MIEIKNRWTGATIATGREGETVKDLVVRVVEEKGSLKGANLMGANLTGANLVGANLAEANLAEANLAEANLRAWLMGANLMGANLTGVYLAGAQLANANLASAKMPDGRKWEDYSADPLAGICTEPEARKRAIGAWGNHEWANCPMHAAHGWGSVDDAPRDKRRDVAAFVAVFDARLLARPAG
jgi:hypothetical protein